MGQVTAHDAGVDLAAANLFYRRPELYDQVQADAEHTVARQVEQAVAECAPDAETLLDLGCGTGRDLEYLAARFDCVGVDLQPQLVTYAGKIRPELDIRVGDMRSFRLGRVVDVITCLGNSLAYVHDAADLAAVFETFAAHAVPGTLLVISTLTAPVMAEPRTYRVDTADLHGEVAISYRWDEATSINTMRRTWLLDDGTGCADDVRRHVVTPDELAVFWSSAGFERRTAQINQSGDDRCIVLAAR
jgi:SAM-dependent methyltransferase